MDVSVHFLWQQPANIRESLHIRCDRSHRWKSKGSKSIRCPRQHTHKFRISSSTWVHLLRGSQDLHLSTWINGGDTFILRILCSKIKAVTIFKTDITPISAAKLDRWRGISCKSSTKQSSMGCSCGFFPRNRLTKGSMVEMSLENWSSMKMKNPVYNAMTILAEVDSKWR